MAHGIDASPQPRLRSLARRAWPGKYIDPDLNVDGRSQQAKGYVTDIFNERAVAFLNRQHSAPFCLFLAHKCVHPDLEQRADGTISDPNAAKFLPAERHKSLYAADKPPRRPNAFVPPLDKPALMRSSTASRHFRPLQPPMTKPSATASAC